MIFKTVFVLGSGPAGLLCAQAAADSGKRVRVFSNSIDPSVIGGAQYIHSFLPGLARHDDARPVQYIRKGTPEGYAAKIYGPKIKPEETSWFKFGDNEMAWPMQLIYEKLWDSWGLMVQMMNIDIDEVRDLKVRAVKEEALIFSTIPRPVITPWANQYKWLKEEIIIKHDVAYCEPYQIIYNGDPNDEWYRTSDLFGHMSTEYPGNVDVEGQRITKPLSTDAPFPADIVPMGRYGCWVKGILADSAYWATRELLRVG